MLHNNANVRGMKYVAQHLPPSPPYKRFTLRVPECNKIIPPDRCPGDRPGRRVLQVLYTTFAKLVM